MTAGGVAKPARRFYDTVAVEAGEGGHRLLLDGRPVRTPAKAEFVLPSAALAAEIAAEWRAQSEHIDPATMPLTKLANSALDGVAPRRSEVVDDIMAYAASDLLCYRAEDPQQLVMKQMALWGPVLDWLAQSLGAAFIVAEGVSHVAQPSEALARLRGAVEPYDDFSLAALQSMAGLTGSAFLALAHAAGLFDLQATWTAAHVDEDWQISQWGPDAEAASRRARCWEEMQAASRLLWLLKPAAD